MVDESIDDSGSGVSRWRAARSTERLQRQFAAPEFDDSGWDAVGVPGHWQSTPAFADHDGTLLYRADLRVPSLQPDQRRWIRFRGLCYSADVFLDGVYLGPTEGYFTTHRFEVSDLIADAGTSVLAIEVNAPPVRPEGPKRAMTGWFTDAPGAPAAWNPAGIWAPITITDTGPVAIRHARAICTEADTRRAVVSMRTVLMANEPADVELEAEIAGVVHRETHTVAAGENRIEWSVEIPEPELWWPHGHGDQVLHDLRIRAYGPSGEISDRTSRRIGLRTTSMTDFIVRVNNRRIFCRGINVAPFRHDLASMTTDELHAEAAAIREAGFTMVRVRSHVTRPEFLDACDTLGLLVWQDLPLSGPFARGVTSRAEEQTRELVDLHAHRPSIVVWGAHMRPHTAETRTTAAPNLRQQQLPSWNRTVLDRAITREFEKSDPSRPCVSHSDVAPHVPRLNGSDLALYFGWHDGEAADLAEYAATLPRLVRFVTNLGAQALPAQLGDGLDALVGAPGAEADTLRRVLPPADFETVAEWADASRTHQAEVLATTLDVLRVLKYRPTGGFFAGVWKTPGFGLSRALFDADGSPRPAFEAARRGVQPIHPVVYPPVTEIASRTTSKVGVYVCNDTADDVELDLVATITDARGQRSHRWSGHAAADEVTFIADVSLRGGRIGDVAEIALAVQRRTDGVVLGENHRSFVAG